MLFPLRDSTPSRTYPLVNTLIIASCGMVFAYQLLLGPRVQGLVAVAAFVPARLFHSLPPWAIPGPHYGLLGNLATILMSMFLHGGWMHIIGNMWFLYIFGDNVEDAIGHLRYLLFYLGAGVVATLAYALSSPTSTMPMIGASGAIAAVLGAYLVWFPRSRVHTLVFLGIFITMAELPGIVFLGFWFLLQFFEGTLSLASTSAGDGGVAWFAHIGGFAFGFLVAVLMKRGGRIRLAEASHPVWYRY